MSTRQTAAEEWKLGWALVLAASIGFSFHSVMMAATGLFMEPLGRDFGWSRSQLSAGISIASIIQAVLSPFFGILIDRWGTRRIAIPGLVLTTIVISSFSLATGSWTQWVTLWVLYALVSLAIKSTVWTTAVAGVFTAGRGLAIGMTMTGAALAQVVTPPFANMMIENFGWRAAFFWVGIIWGGAALLLSIFFLFDAHDRNRKAIAMATPDKPAAIPAPLQGLSIGQAWRDPALWSIAASTLIMMVLTIAVLVHQFPLLTAAGVSRANAAWLTSLFGIAGIIGKLVTGWMMDRWHGRIVGGVTLASSSIAFVLLLEPFRTPLLIAVAMFINGYASGTKLQICGYLTTRYAGMRNFGTIFGFMASVIALGSGLGPMFGGLIYDHFGNYTPLLLAGIVGCLVSGLLIFRLGDYPDWEQPKAQLEVG